MRPHHLRASKTSLAKHCLYWAREDVQIQDGQSSSPQATTGTQVHRACEQTIRGEPVDVLTGEARELYRVWLDWYHPHGAAMVLQPEVGMWLDLNPPRLRAWRGKRDEGPLPAGCIHGTADAVGMYTEQGARVLHVIDWKTGRAEHVEPAAENAQLLTYVAMASIVHPDVDVYRVSVAHITTSGVVWDTVDVDQIDIDAWVATLRGWLERVAVSQPQAGPHCRRLYCRAHGHCPATTHGLTQLLPNPRFRVAAHMNQIANAEHATAQYEALRAAEAAIATAWHALRNWSEVMGPVPLPHGEGTWGSRQETRESVHLTADNYAEVAALVGDEALRGAVEYKLTKTALEEIAAKSAKAKGLQIKEEKQRILGSLRNAKVITAKTGTVFVETKEKKNES